ncbi:hypothetical protein [Xenorhabdus sp. PR6a]|uniref:hypothetical protein n=1 Tax=Xenorhabdus sp. PR6a TaxID=3025877 RepID=UPI00235A2734|nr:hypothetical protein [Xenorhabdus sp. PR6a]
MLDYFIKEGDPQEFMLSWTAQDKDQWVVDNVGLSRANKELALFDSKWFDYRHLHSMDATILFAEAYKREYSQIMLRHGREDFRKAPFKTGLKRCPFINLSKSNITSLWKARQKADELGVEYGYFIMSMLSIAAKREWGELPRPQHLWQDDLLEIFTEKNEKRKGTRLNGSELDYFKKTNYLGDEIQDAHRKYVMGQIADARPDKRHFLIFSAVFTLEYIDQQIFVDQFPNEFRKASKFL